MPEELFAVPLDMRFATLALVVVIAGIARGLSGFGTGMIVVPVAAALYNPATAVVMVVVIDTLPIVPLTLPVLKIARWKEVLPCLFGLAALLPLGVFILKHGDPEVLRWVICIAILVLAAILWSGWRYHGPRNVAISFGVGGLAGVLSGTASVPGPPVIMYWLASSLPAAIVRANLMSLFLLGDALSIFNLWNAGLFAKERLMLGVVSTPFYLVGLAAGWALYGVSGETTYRRVTFGLIVASAVLALPPTRHLFDALAALLA